MGQMQILVVVITVMLNMLDGFDVASIALATNGIMAEFGLDDRRALGIVLSMELIGMAIGSVFLGGVADRMGRRPTMLGCLAVMSVGMFMVTREPGFLANGIISISNAVGLLEDAQVGIIHIMVWRLITGLGIGGMLAAINAVVAEYSNAKRKHLNVALMAIGYPVGVAAGAKISAAMLDAGMSWHSIFMLGFWWTAALIPIVFFLVPETVAWLVMKRRPDALAKVNATLKRIGHAPVGALPEQTEEESKASILDIFSPMLLMTTILVTCAYFFHITTFYFVAKWVPYFVSEVMGFAPGRAADMLFWVSVGGATGGLLLGLLTLKMDLRKLTIASMVGATVLVIVFGSSPYDLGWLALICFGAGFTTNAAINGMYAIFAHAYPTHVRAVGTGFAIGVGRGGAVLGPTIAGFLLEGGLEMPGTAVVMSIGSLIAAGALLFLRLRPEPPEAVRTESASVSAPPMAAAATAAGAR
jgi:MFS family permease